MKNEYGNFSVRYSRSSGEAASEDCRLVFEDVVVVGGTKSLFILMNRLTALDWCLLLADSSYNLSLKRGVF